MDRRIHKLRRLPQLKFCRRQNVWVRVVEAFAPIFWSISASESIAANRVAETGSSRVRESQITEVLLFFGHVKTDVGLCTAKV